MSTVSGNVPGPDEEPPQKRVCILHAQGVPIKHGDFTFFSNLTDKEERLRSIQNVRDKRLTEPVGSSKRMPAVCSQIPDKIESEHGYHRGCYKRFMSHVSQAQMTNVDDMTRKRQRTGQYEHIIFDPDCIFCNVVGKIHVRKGRNRSTQNTSSFERDGWQRVLEIAEARQDERLLRRIRGYDLFACEAKYHASCRKHYTAIPSEWRSRDETAKSTQTGLEAAHEEAFLEVAQYVEHKVIAQHEIIKLTELRNIYVAKLSGTLFDNPDYRAAKLKEKLIKHHTLGPELSFTKVSSADKFDFTVVFSSRIDPNEAVGRAYQMATQDIKTCVAHHLREAVLCRFKDIDELVWPPSPMSLEVNEETIPPQLYKFLKSLLCDNEQATEHTPVNKERVILSIGQDICRSITNGRWKLPKHILLSVSLHHLFRSKHLLTMINRLGHCENYSFCLELETDIALALNKSSTLLTPKIAKGADNVLFHSEWDNFNQNLTGLQGPTTCNTAAGIMLQETCSPRIVTSAIQTIERSGRRSLPSDTFQRLAQMSIGRRNGPSIIITEQNPPPDNSIAYQRALLIYTIWTISRQTSSLARQTVPAFAGFVSVTGVVPDRATTLDFYPSITEPITEYNVVRELLLKCEQATKEVGQKYTITTFDLGVCMKALPIIWKDPASYRGHIILIGAFHTIMNYLNMLGHKMAGSGYSEILIEADLVTTGCLNKVLHGKKYSKSLWCLKVVSEAFERLLIQSFLDQRTEEDTSNADVLVTLLNNLNASTLQSVVSDQSSGNFINEFQVFQGKVRNGVLGKTAQFWMSFLDQARLVFLLIYAIKVNDFRLFHKCMGDMAALFFSFGGQNYARYLTWFDVFLTNIETSHPGANELLKRGAISVARSLTPGNLCAVDKTMEETFMKFAKSRGGSSGSGLTGILQNYGAYQRWIRTSSERCKFYQATLEMTGQTSEFDLRVSSKHKETLPSQIKISESAVQRAISAIAGYTNPFMIDDKDRLYILSSGAPVPTDVTADVLSAEEVGRKMKSDFVNERLVENDEVLVEFFDRIPKAKLKRMDACNKVVKLTSSQGKLIQFQEQGNIAFQLLVKSQSLERPLDIEELMTYSLTPVPHSLATPDGFMAKTDKAKMIHLLTDHLPEIQPPPPGDTLYVEDGNAMVHSMKDIPPTFRDIALQILERLGGKPCVVFSTDMYAIDSIKAQERLRRGSSDRILLEGVNTRKPADFSNFLQNADNKKQLFDLIHRVWTSDTAASRIFGRMVVLVVEGIAYKLTSVGGHVVEEILEDVTSTQEETDTRVVLYLNYAQSQHYKNAVVRSPDTDIFFILLYYAQTLNQLAVYFDTGTGNKRRILNVSEIANDLGHSFCEAVVGFYVFTGEDCNCAFKGKGKVLPFKKLQKNPKFQKAFASLGNSWDVSGEVLFMLEEFVCLMYGFPRKQNINTVRTLMLKKIVGGDDLLRVKSSKVDLSKLPPCKDSLIPHIKRVNYRLRQWKLAHITDPSIQHPCRHGWTDDDVYLQPVWSEGPILPDSLQDLVEGSSSEESDELSDSDGEDSDSEGSDESDSD